MISSFSLLLELAVCPIKTVLRRADLEKNFLLMDQLQLWENFTEGLGPLYCCYEQIVFGGIAQK